MANDKKTLIKTAYLHFRDGRWNEAIQEYQKLLQLDHADILALNMLGDAYAQLGKVTEALQYYRQILSIFNKEGAKDKVLIIQRKMGKLDPNSVEESPEAAPEPALAEEEPKDLGSFKEPIEQLRSKILSDPKNPELYQKLAALLVKAGRPVEASEQLAVVANSLFNGKMFKKAQSLYEEIVKLDPGNLAAHIALGEIFGKENSDSEAKKEFLFVAEILIRQGNLDRAQLFAQKAIQLKSIEAHYYLGLIYYQKSQLAEARAEFETLLKFKVNHQGALTHLGSILAGQNQLAEALVLYERLVKADPKNADALAKMADIASRQGQSTIATERYDQATDAFAREEQWERAAMCASQAVRLDPQNAERYLKLADAAYNAGLEQQAAEACLALAEIYEGQGKSAEAGQVRAKAKELLGQESEVTAAAPQALAAPVVKGPDPAETKAARVPAPASKPAAEAPRPKERKLTPAEEAKVMLNIAANYIRQGSIDEAIEIYQKILRTDPNNEEVKTALTRAYAMFAGVNPETALSKRGAGAAAAPKPASPQEGDEQKVQREARERAQREAQVRTQRGAAESGPAPAAAKPAAKDHDFMQPEGHSREDEISGDKVDEFMTVTVAEIYTKQGLLNEALKIYQKILEMEPGNLEAKMKKDELEGTLAEQERLRIASEEAARARQAQEQAAKAAAEEAPPPVADAPAPKKNNDNDSDSPGKGKRGRVSYV